MYDNALIFGKNQKTKIVSIEPQDNFAEIFFEKDNGDIYSEYVPNRYWILSNKPLNNRFVRLKGDLYYKYGIQFKTREEFIKAKSYWKHEDIYSVYDPKEALMLKDGYTYYKDLKPKDVSILSFDIETTSLKLTPDAKLLLISNTFRKNGKIERKLFACDDHDNEGEMIYAWCTWVQSINPSIICGHNITSYDFPFLQYIAEKAGCSGLPLGRDDSNVQFNSYESKFRVDGSRDLHYKRIKIFGREICDTYFLAIKHDIASKKYESYGLKNIIKQEGLEDKDRQFYDASLIRYNYRNSEEWSKIKKYCENDSDDSLKLFDLMVSPFWYMSQSIPKNFQLVVESASGSQLNSIMVRSYLQEGHSIPKTSETYEYEGALSMGVPGIYRNAFKIDVASLYPSIMLEYEVYDKEKDPKGNFLKMLQFFTNERLKHKKLYKETGNEYHDSMQAAYKIFINSAYGFMGTNGLNFNSISNAAFVTKKGREILEFAIEWATGKKYEVQSS